MDKYPKNVREMQKALNVPDEAIIQVKVPQGEPRVCDYCNDILIDGEGIALEKCHLTDYGLMCNTCLGETKPSATYSRETDVSKEQWYQDGIE